jgi:multidrug resistance efflux pump
VLESGGRPGIVAAAEADVEVAEAALNEAKAQEALVKGLVDQGASGAWELQTASLAVAVAEAQVAAAQASVGAAINQPHGTEVVAAQDRLLAAEARMELADARAAATTLRSPIAGKASRPGGSVLVTVQDPSVSLVQVAVPEALRARIEPGAAADFRPTQGGSPVAAQVLSVSDAAVAGPSGPVIWTLARLENPLPFGSTGLLRIATGGGR